MSPPLWFTANRDLPGFSVSLVENDTQRKGGYSNQANRDDEIVVGGFIRPCRGGPQPGRGCRRRCRRRHMGQDAEGAEMFHLGRHLVVHRIDGTPELDPVRAVLDGDVERTLKHTCWNLGVGVAQGHGEAGLKVKPLGPSDRRRLSRPAAGRRTAFLRHGRHGINRRAGIPDDAAALKGQNTLAVVGLEKAGVITLPFPSRAKWRPG
ncbi:hypothetical protein Dform_01837 [Dehalogenimonas formicexedens]|uniref:Uncharacterized protein n=1 Tax=Dehalogenimonas formicexedens TaxID=1839801 RepID=A0A1P8F9L4_9CHLR|nr:hypothetical protein Dform_01837 [Dehalogenimonas formicexedens]